MKFRIGSLLQESTRVIMMVKMVLMMMIMIIVKILEMIAYSIFSLYRNTKIIHSIMMIWQNNFINSNYNWRRALRKILEE